MRPTAVLIAGPTASGKSGLAAERAARDGGVIINADSMQVYAELEILTARPTAAETARFDHRLYGHVSARSAYSVARWLDDCRAALDDAATQGRPAIVVGGTGLYFRALTLGLSPVPTIPDAVRTRWRRLADETTPDALHAMLRDRDPHMAARLDATDRQRMTRALEVIDATGRSLADWQSAAKAPPLLDASTCERWVIDPERAALAARIDARFDAMVEAGAFEEAARIAAMHLDPALPAARAIGVAPLISALKGEISRADAIAQAKAQSRQYAKRQVTWFRHQMADWPRRPMP